MNSCLHDANDSNRYTPEVAMRDLLRAKARFDRFFALHRGERPRLSVERAYRSLMRVIFRVARLSSPRLEGESDDELIRRIYGEDARFGGGGNGRGPRG